MRNNQHFYYVFGALMMCALFLRDSRPVGAIGFIALGALILYFQRSFAEQSFEASRRRLPGAIVTDYLPTLLTLRFKQSYWLFSWRASAVLFILFGIGALVIR